MGKQICGMRQKKKSISPVKVTQLGSNWNNGLNDSTFYWNVNNSSTNRNANISSGAVNALKTNPVKICLPCHLAKQNNCLNLYW